MNAVSEAERMAAADGVTQLRQPPQAIEAEQSVLGALLLDNLAWDHVGDLLGPGDFYAHDHRLIFGAIAALSNACKAADIITVHAHLQASNAQGADAIELTYLNALLQSVPSARFARSHAEIVRKRSLQRALIANMDESTAQAWDQEADPSDTLSAIAQRLDALQQGQLIKAPRSVQDLVVKRLDAYNDAASGNLVPGWSTGLRDLDEVLGGGLFPGGLYIVAARPSVGKTACSLQIGLHRATAGDGVLVLSMEMPEAECMDRMISNVGLVDYKRLRANKMTDHDWSGVSRAAETIAHMAMWVDDEGALTLRHIRNKAMSLRRQGLRVLVIDYLQLCSGPGIRGMNRNGEIEEITRGLKALAKQLGIAIVLLSQLNREVEKRSPPEPVLADLRDSGGIEQDADAVIFLWPTGRYVKGAKIVACSIGKNRQGEQLRGNDAIPLEFHGWHMRFYDSDLSMKKVLAGPVDQVGGFD